MINPSQKEDLRHAVLEILATRHPAALPVRAIRRRAADEVDFILTDEEAGAALQFLKGLEHVENLPDALGSTDYWRATSQGVLAYERGTTPRKPSRD